MGTSIAAPIDVFLRPVASTRRHDCLIVLHAAQRALLAGLAGSSLLVRPAWAEDVDAVDSAVVSVTAAVKVGLSVAAVVEQTLEQRVPAHSFAAPFGRAAGILHALVNVIRCCYVAC